MQLSDRVGRRIKLHDLHVLMAVAQTGSMSKAAALLNTGQPAISRSIAELEHMLGIRLFERSRQGVTATKYGRALLDGGTRVFDDLRQAFRSIEYLADPTAGEIRIGANPFLAAGFVSATIDRLSRQYPRMVFRVVPGNIATLHRALVDRSVDILISRKFGPISDETIRFERLFEDRYSVVVGANHPLAGRRKLELGELMKQRWVLPSPDGPLGSVAIEAFRTAGLAYPRAAVIGPAEVRTSLLATGQYVSIVPNSVLRFSVERQNLRVLPIKTRFGGVPVGAAVLEDRSIGPVAKLFIECCREVAKHRTS